jgi:hypothetical protein
MDEQKQQQELVTIAGGVEMEVAYQNNGDKETVKVRQIPISKIQDYAAVIYNDAEAIEFYCDKPKGWADTLTMDSASAIADKGLELNGDFFDRWWARRKRVIEIQQRGMITGASANEPAPPEKASASASSPLPSPTTTT